MLYTSFLPWAGKSKSSDFHPYSQPSYNLKIASSNDLINWKRDYKSILEFGEGEFIHGKPVLYEDTKNKFELYFSVRGNSYRIAVASGTNIENLKRGINLKFKFQEWISETQEYAFPILFNKTKYLFFNGNGYGRTGLGYTILKN